MECKIFAFSDRFAISIVQQWSFLLAMDIDLLKIADNLTDGVDDGEGIGILAADLCQLGHLRIIDHTEEHIDLFIQVHTSAWDQGHAMVELMDDGVADFLGMFGDDLETHRAAAIFGQPL